jgi:hypothetical protein
MRKNIRWYNNPQFVQSFVELVAQRKIEYNITTYSNTLIQNLQSIPQEHLPQVIRDEIDHTEKSCEDFFKAAQKSLNQLKLKNQIEVSNIYFSLPIKYLNFRPK